MLGMAFLHPYEDRVHLKGVCWRGVRWVASSFDMGGIENFYGLAHRITVVAAGTALSIVPHESLKPFQRIF